VSVVSVGINKWKIVTKKGREIDIEAPYVTETEAKLLSTLLDAIIDKLEKYYVEFEFTLPTGQTITVKAQLKSIR